MMLGFPMLMYYLWICLWFYDGKLVYPASFEDTVPFLGRMWAHIRDVCTHEGLDIFLTSTGYRMQAPMHTLGKSIPVSWSISSSSHWSCQGTNKKDFLYLLLGIRPSCITAMRSTLSTQLC